MPACRPRSRRALFATTLGLAAFAVTCVSAPTQVALAVGARTGTAPVPASTAVAELRAEVTRTGDRLAAATVAYEQGQIQLGVLVQRKLLTGRSVEELQQQAVAAQLRVSSLASSLYRNPVSPALNAALVGDLRSVDDYLFLKRNLDQSGADQRRDIAVLTTQATDTQALLRRQDDAATAAIRLQAKLDTDLTRLQTDAQASQVRLQKAVATLRRRQQAAAARTLAATEGGPACARPVPTDAINGFLPDQELCPLRSAPGHRLVAPAAQAFDAMSAAFRTSVGTSMCVTDSYRDYAAQVDVFTRKPNLAATPGRSQHGWGRAVDLCGGVQQDGTPPYLWLEQNAATFGFVHPDWAEPDGSRPEPWHWEFNG